MAPGCRGGLLPDTRRAARSLSISRAAGLSFWTLAGIGLIWVGLDELLGIHEGAGMLLERAGVPTAPYLDRHNDTILFLYMLGGAAVAMRFWHELVDRPHVAEVFLAGVIVFSASIVLDAKVIFDGSRARILEELLELLASAIFFAAFQLRAAYEQPDRPRAGASALDISESYF